MLEFNNDLADADADAAAADDDETGLLDTETVQARPTDPKGIKEIADPEKPEEDTAPRPWVTAPGPMSPKGWEELGPDSRSFFDLFFV